jgi:MSHA biogenesis protein MshO
MRKSKLHFSNFAKPDRSQRPVRFYVAGFTLVELLTVIIIIGIIGGIVGMFITRPINEYMDIARRAEMTDIADTALRRMGRDIRTAVPNSVRVPSSSSQYLEFLPTKTGGRYRSDSTGVLCSAITGNVDNDGLSFSNIDTCFEIIGAAINLSAGDSIVVGSTQSDGNPPYQDPTNLACGIPDTSTCIRRVVPIAGAGLQQKVVITSPYTLPFFANLSSQRFEVISASEQAVTYACENVGGTVDGTGTLKRYSGYGFKTAQLPPASLGVAGILLADKISACNILYSLPNQRNGLVAISLTLLRGGESISLYHEIHVNNLP